MVLTVVIAYSKTSSTEAEVNSIKQELEAVAGTLEMIGVAFILGGMRNHWGTSDASITIRESDIWEGDRIMGGKKWPIRSYLLHGDSDGHDFLSSGSILRNQWQVNLKSFMCPHETLNPQSFP
jgi:hypothetical protein